MKSTKTSANNLKTVKSLVTLALTLVFCYLAIVGNLTPEFMTVYTTVIAFYFGTQKVKDYEKDEK